MNLVIVFESKNAELLHYHRKTNVGFDTSCDTTGANLQSYCFDSRAEDPTSVTATISAPLFTLITMFTNILCHVNAAFFPSRFTS